MTTPFPGVGENPERAGIRVYRKQVTQTYALSGVLMTEHELAAHLRVCRRQLYNWRMIECGSSKRQR